MLNFIRERAQGWVAWFIVGLISIPFALWGVNSYLTGPSDVIVAKVNGETIKQAEYQRAFQQYRDRMRTSLGKDFDPTLFDSLELKKSVVNGLIEQKLLLSAGKDLGQSISSGALSQMIKATPAFQRDGEFNTDLYSMVLARANLSPEKYEADLHIDSLRQELANNVQKSTIVTQSAINNVVRLEKQMREVAYGVITVYPLLESISVSDEEVKAYFDGHKADYRAPERVTVDYVELSVDEIAKGIEVNESDLQAFYMDNKNQFVGPEQRQASHILIEGDEAVALDVLTDAITRLEQGEDFASLAEELSQDAGSAKEGGDLGYFQRDVMDPEFEKEVFSMASIGDVSEPVKTEFGYHLIKLTGIKASELSFSDAKSDVEMFYRKQEAEGLFYEQAELLADLSYENPDSLDLVSEELSLEIKTSKDILRESNATGIGKDKKVADVAFSEDVLVNGLNSAVVELNKSHLLVLHKNKHTPATQLAYDSVAPAITEQLRYINAKGKAAEMGDAILVKLKAGEDPVSLFGEKEWVSKQLMGRKDSNVSEQILSRAFALAKPVMEGAEYLGFTADNGNYIVLKVSGVQEGDVSGATEEMQDALRNSLVRVYEGSELQSFINAIKSEADIELFEQYL